MKYWPHARLSEDKEADVGKTCGHEKQKQSKCNSSAVKKRSKGNPSFICQLNAKPKRGYNSKNKVEATFTDLAAEIT